MTVLVAVLVMQRTDATLAGWIILYLESGAKPQSLLTVDRLIEGSVERIADLAMKKAGPKGAIYLYDCRNPRRIAKRSQRRQLAQVLAEAPNQEA